MTVLNPVGTDFGGLSRAVADLRKVLKLHNDITERFLVIFRVKPRITDFNKLQSYK
ncbi:hypothetical protein D1AOALGA4SA_9261 [Olavius algarvensis Delta 1 endosymbiont]|nr:hypothetical protein D1AOALGA4SA_9261 [Olavius algarvensis Delta 1 endosymbiont]